MKIGLQMHFVNPKFDLFPTFTMLMFYLISHYSVLGYDSTQLYMVSSKIQMVSPELILYPYVRLLSLA